MGELTLRRWRALLPAAILIVLLGMLASCVEGCVPPDDWGRDRAATQDRP